MSSLYRTGRWMILLAMVLTSIGAFTPSQAQTLHHTPSQDLIQQLEDTTASNVTIAYHAETGNVRFIGTDLQHSIARPTQLKAPSSPEQAAMQFAETYGGLFGLHQPKAELTVMRSQVSDNGHHFVRYQQVHQGVPILGGEIIVQTNQDQALLSMGGEVLPTFELNTTPAISVDQAIATARATLAKHYGYALTTFEVDTPSLWIYNPALLGGPGIRMNRLVWRMEMTALDAPEPVREFVLVDAQMGMMSLHFNQIAHAKYRLICNRNNVPDNDQNPNNNCDQASEYVRLEGQAAGSVADVNLAYDYSGITYDYFFNRFGRDSIDGAGMPLYSLVKYCYPSVACPYGNAFWNGRQMTYGDGYASADDVVGHELAHGVTEFTAGLFYYYQSGAINESMSDVFGELIDFTSGFGGGRGNDTASARWLMGEDLSIGAIRNMKDPTLYSDPDRTGSPYYNLDATGSDSGGVHSNSGVNNKAAYLMVDGGSFNGYTVTALGENKTAQIYYYTLAYLLTSGSDYQDLFNDLQQACSSLIGKHGITYADCQEVRDAVLATQMNVTPTNAPATDAVQCVTAGQYPIYSFNDDLENTASGNWVSSTASGTNYWFYPSRTSAFGNYGYATSGKNNFWGYSQGATSDTRMSMTKSVLIPTGGAMFFRHSYGFENNGSSMYDGGVLEYSTNNGSTWTNAGSLFVNNGYNGTLLSGTPLGAINAFVGESNGYISSKLSLNSLAGQSVRFRFRIGTDTNGNDYGWFIDDISIYRCLTLPKKVFVPLTQR